MHCINQNIPIIFSILSIRIILSRVVRRVKLEKFQKINLIAKIGFCSLLIDYHFLMQKIKNSFNSMYINKLILGFSILYKAYVSTIHFQSDPRTIFNEELLEMFSSYFNLSYSYFLRLSTLISFSQISMSQVLTGDSVLISDRLPYY